MNEPKELRFLLKNAKSTIRSWSMSYHQDKKKEGYDSAKLALTQGQVLQKDQNGKLKMTPCWLEVKIEHDYMDDEVPYKIAFRPLLPGMYIDVYLSVEFLESLTKPYRYFGGKIVRFKHGVDPQLNINRPIGPQIKSYAARTTPAIEHIIYEGTDGSLVVGYRGLFELDKLKDSSINRFDCYINRYNGLSWIEPSDEPDEDGVSDLEMLYYEVAATGTKAVIVPTIWLKEDGSSECLLDFLANWRQSKRGDRVTSKIGKFIITHELTRGDKLMTQTSLRVSDSIWMSPEYC